MADAILGLPSPEGSGKLLDLELRPATSASSGASVYAERDANWPASPQTESKISEGSLDIGGTVTWTFTNIPSGKTGYLMGGVFASNGGMLFSINAGGSTIYIYTEGGSVPLILPNKKFLTLSAGTHFTVIAANQDSGVRSAFCTLFWDQY